MSVVRCGGMVKKISDYIDGEINETALLKIEAHLSGCKSCAAFIKTLRKTILTLRKKATEVKLPSQMRNRLRLQLRICATSLKRSR